MDRSAADDHLHEPDGRGSEIEEKYVWKRDRRIQRKIDLLEFPSVLCGYGIASVTDRKNERLRHHARREFLDYCCRDQARHAGRQKPFSASWEDHADRALVTLEATQRGQTCALACSEVGLAPRSNASLDLVGRRLRVEQRREVSRQSERG